MGNTIDERSQSKHYNNATDNNPMNNDNIKVTRRDDVPTLDEYEDRYADETYWLFIKERVMLRYDLQELFDILDLDMDEFCERFSPEILLSLHELDVM